MAADFSEMDRRQSLERFVGLWGQRQQSPAPILFIRLAVAMLSAPSPRGAVLLLFDWSFVTLLMSEGSAGKSIGGRYQKRVVGSKHAR